MKLYNKLSDFSPKGNAIVTSGTFDGVHLGHQKIITRLKEVAKEQNGETVLLTFWPHPRLIVSPNNQDIKLLTTIQEKQEIIAGLGIDHMVVLPFTREFSELTSDKFVGDILVKGLGTKALVIGYDHKFGRNREGGIDYLLQHSDRYKIHVEEITRQEIDNITISSTKIRKALEQGEISTANELLGRNYSFNGPVIKGRQLGRTIGFPTANVSVQKMYKLIPKNGVYATYITLRNSIYKGIMNIGNRPTVDGVGTTMEVNIFDFNDDIYGENIKVEIVEFIREEKKFPDIKSLILQIKTDVSYAQNLLK